MVLKFFKIVFTEQPQLTLDRFCKPGPNRYYQLKTDLLNRKPDDPWKRQPGLRRPTGLYSPLENTTGVLSLFFFLS